MKVINYLKQNYWLTAILVLAAVLRLYHLNFQSLWMDEIYSMNVSASKNTYGEVGAQVMLWEGYPYFYFMFLHTLYFIFGYSEIVARLVSALAGIGAVYMAYKLGKEIFSKNAGLLAALLLAINDFHILYSQEARPYSLFILFTIFAFYRLSVFIKDASVRNAVYFGIGMGLILNINFFGIITVFSQALLVLLYLLLLAKQERMAYFKNALLSAGIALVMFLPNYALLIKLLNLESFWLGPPQADSLTIVFKQFLGNSEVTMFVFGLIFVYYIYTLFKEKTDDFEVNAIKSNRLNYSFIMLFIWIVAFLGILLMKSYGGVSLLLDRYFISIVPVFILTLAIGIALIKNRIAQTGVVIFIFIFSIFNLIGVKKYYKTYIKSQYREVSAFIVKNSKKDDVVYTSLYYWYSYYLVNDKVKTNLQEKPLEVIVQEMTQDPTKIKAFWYADAHNRPFAPSEATKNFLDTHFYVENNFDGFDAWTKHFILIKDAKQTVDISKYKDIQQVNGDTFNFSIETYKDENNVVTLSGWAYFANQSAEKSEVAFVFLNGQNQKMLQTQKVNRSDVTSYFKSKFNIDNSGFSSSINTANFESGKYQLAIYLVNKETKKEGLILTDKFVEK